MSQITTVRWGPVRTSNHASRSLQLPEALTLAAGICCYKCTLFETQLPSRRTVLGRADIYPQHWRFIGQCLLINSPNQLMSPCSFTQRLRPVRPLITRLPRPSLTKPPFHACHNRWLYTHTSWFTRNLSISFPTFYCPTYNNPPSFACCCSSYACSTSGPSFYSPFEPENR